MIWHPRLESLKILPVYDARLNILTKILNFFLKTSFFQLFEFDHKIMFLVCIKKSVPNPDSNRRKSRKIRQCFKNNQNHFYISFLSLSHVVIWLLFKTKERWFPTFLTAPAIRPDIPHKNAALSGILSCYLFDNPFMFRRALEKLCGRPNRLWTDKKFLDT